MSFKALPTKYKAAIIAAALVLVFVIFVKLIFLPIISFGQTQSEKAANLRKSTGYVDELNEELSSLESRRQKLTATVMEINDNERQNRTNAAKMLDWLGLEAKAYYLDIISFNEPESSTSDGRVTETTLSWELRGPIPNLYKFIEDLDELGIKHSVGSINLRIDEDYDFLGRYYDAVTSIPWYSDPLKDAVQPASPSNAQPEVSSSEQPQISPETKPPASEPEEPVKQETLPPVTVTSPNTSEPPQQPIIKEPDKTEKAPENERPTLNERISDLLTNTHNIIPEFKAIKIPTVNDFRPVLIVDAKDYSQGNYRLRMTVRFYTYSSMEEVA